MKLTKREKEIIRRALFSYFTLAKLANDKTTEKEVEELKNKLEL